MVELIHKIILLIHIPCGFLSLVLFWIPVATKKGGRTHRRIGKIYYYTMWIVLATSAILSVCNFIVGKNVAALYLGYLTIITAYPLWYSDEILFQKGNWSHRYFIIRKVFLAVLSLSAVGMIFMGSIIFKFQGMGIMMIFFGLVAIPSAKEILLSRKSAQEKEGKLKMHIQGTIITGIAAYTAFFAFGGARIMIGVLGMSTQWMVIPWILPSLLGIIYMRYMKRKYRV